MITAGIVLSGCGVFDGSELHETVVTLLALDRAGVQVIAMAPNVDFDVIDHCTQEATGERRNVLTEAARIVRGNIRDIADVELNELDALFFPGGFGAAKNLCNFASAGADAQVQPDVLRLTAAAFDARLPICGICIAPALLAAVLRGRNVQGQLTIGTDEGTAAALGSMGAQHMTCPVEEFRVDADLRLVTTPAYMLAGGIAEAAEGIEAAVAATLALVPNK